MSTTNRRYISFIAFGILEFRLKSDFIRLTKYSRRPIPVKPQNSDATGGYRVWLEVQMYLACLITCLLFCFSTGQLEAWAMVWDNENCSPPRYQRTQWKYPTCDDFPDVTESCTTTSISNITTDCLFTAGEPLTCGNECIYTPPLDFNENDVSNMYDPPDTTENYPLMAINRTCWNPDPNPQGLPDCPFEAPDDFLSTSSFSSRQLKIRVAVAVVLEHIQLLLLWAIMKRNKSATGNTENSWKMQREWLSIQYTRS